MVFDKMDPQTLSFDVWLLPLLRPKLKTQRRFTEAPPDADVITCLAATKNVRHSRCASSCSSLYCMTAAPLLRFWVILVARFRPQFDSSS